MSVEIKKYDLKRKPGMQKLYLTIYRGYSISKDGKKKLHQSQKSLDLEIYSNPQNDHQKRHNENVWKIAEEVRAETYLRLSRGKHNIKDKNLALADFFQYMDKKIEIASSTSKHKKVFIAASKHLKTYTKNITGKDRLPFTSISGHFLEGFKKHLLYDAWSRYGKQIKPNTAKAYFARIGFMLNQAVKDKIIERNPFKDVNKLKGEEVFKNKLTIDEIKRLQEATVDDNVIKDAFLFMCFTGLRFSDTKNLKYGDIRNGNGYSITLRQKKTNKIVTVPLNQDALNLIGRPNEDNLFDSVFPGLVYSGYNNLKLEKWIMKAMILDKKITWHSARHTFGQLLHDNGVDIATIANLMGDAIQTVIRNYVRISENTKIDAVKKLEV